jgi:4-hydroxy-tetrahydrodipicolinate reductase
VFRKALELISPILKPDFDIEIVETHHNKKADSPSGTAKILADAVDPDNKLLRVSGRDGMCGARQKDEIGIFAMRGGTVAGRHTVNFFGDDEIFSISHEAVSRRIFALGALKAARILMGKTAGFYELADILFQDGDVSHG